MEVLNVSSISINSSMKTFGFVIKNPYEGRLSGIRWNLNTGIDLIDSIKTIDLGPKEQVFIFNQYDYPLTGDFMVTASATDGITKNSKSLPIDVEDLELRSLSAVNANGTKRILQLIVENSLTENLTNVSWFFDTKDGGQSFQPVLLWFFAFYLKSQCRLFLFSQRFLHQLFLVSGRVRHRRFFFYPS